jgi:hypothetical protein
VKLNITGEVEQAIAKIALSRGVSDQETVRWVISLGVYLETARVQGKTIIVQDSSGDQSAVVDLDPKTE